MTTAEPFEIGTIELAPRRRVRAHFSKPLFSEKTLDPAPVPTELVARGGTLVFRPELQLPAELADLYAEGDRPVVLGGRLDLTGVDVPAPERSNRPMGYTLELPSPRGRAPLAEPQEITWNCRLDESVTRALWQIIVRARALDERLAERGSGFASIEDRARAFAREAISHLTASIDDHKEMDMDRLAKRLAAVRFFLGRSLELESSLRGALALHQKASARFMNNLTGALVEGVFYMFDDDLSAFWDALGEGRWTRKALQEALEDSTGAIAERSIKGVRDALGERLGVIDDALNALDSKETIRALERSIEQLRGELARLNEHIGSSYARAIAAARSEGAEDFWRFADRAKALSEKIAAQIAEADALRHASSERLADGLKLVYEREAIEEVTRQLDEVAARTGPQKLQALSGTLRGLRDPKSAIDVPAALAKNRRLSETAEAMETLMRGLADPGQVASSEGLRTAQLGLHQGAELMEKLRKLEELKLAPTLFTEMEAIASKMAHHPSKTGFRALGAGEGALMEAYLKKLGSLAEVMGISHSEPDALFRLVEAQAKVMDEAFKKQAKELGTQDFVVGAHDLAERAKNWDDAWIMYANESAEGKVNNLLLASEKVSAEASRDAGPPPSPSSVDTSGWQGAVSWLAAQITSSGLWSALQAVISVISFVLAGIARMYQYVVDQIARFITTSSRYVSDSYVEEDDAEAARLRSRLRSEGRLDQRFYEAWPEITAEEVRGLSAENLVRDASGKKEEYVRLKTARFQNAAQEYETRQWRFGATAIHALCVNAVSAENLGSLNDIDASVYEFGPERRDIGGFSRLERVRTGLAEAFAMTDSYDTGQRGFVGNFVDTATRVVSEGDFNPFNSWNDDDGLTWHDWDWIVDWISWFLSWGVRIGGMLLALGVATGTLGAGTLAGGAIVVASLKFADGADQIGALIKAAIAGLATVPATARLQSDALLSQMKTFDELFGK